MRVDTKKIHQVAGRVNILVVSHPFPAAKFKRIYHASEKTRWTDIAHGMCYIASGYVGDAHRPTFALRPGASGEFAAKDDYADNPFIAWYQPKCSPYNTSQIVYGDNLYTVYDQGFMTCHNALTGEEMFGKVRFPQGGSFTASPWAYNGRIFCLSEDGNTYVAKAGDQFELLATNPLDELCIATPSIADGKLLLRTLTKLYCITGK